MQTLTTIFECNGEQVAVTTVRQEGEDLDVFYARHEAEVAAKKAELGCG